MTSKASNQLFQWARLEFKAAEAFDEETRSAQRLYDSMIERRDQTYLDALKYGVPLPVAMDVYNETTQEAELVKYEGRLSKAKALKHRERGEAFMVKRDKQVRKDLRVRFSG